MDRLSPTRCLGWVRCRRGVHRPVLRSRRGRGRAVQNSRGFGIVQALFYGIAPAVAAIITIAAYKLLKLTDRRDWRLWAISATVFGVTALTGSEPIPLILAAGLGVLLLDARPKTLWPRLWRRAPGRPPVRNLRRRARCCCP